MKKFITAILVLCAVVGCSKDGKIPKEIDGLAVDIDVHRFDKLFADATMADLPRLKSTYPYLFSKQYTDEYWKAKLSDTLQNEIEEQVAQVFPSFDDVEEDLELLYKHITYYFPKTTVPKTITVTTKVDYRNKVVLADSLLLVALDTYLGSDHYFYGDIQKYFSKNFRKEQIDVDVALAFAKAKVPQPLSNTFLSEMVYEGKKLYLAELLLPLKSKHEIFSYTQDEYTFATENEINVWQYFVANEHLYSTERKLFARFIDPAPFSKFYLELDNETPGRIGRYMGYKIVKSYMEKSDTPLKNMLILDAETLFQKSKYKP